MAGGLLDDPDLLAAAASDAGLDPEQLMTWSATDEVAQTLEADAAAARSASAHARALDHRLSGPREHRRYSAPSYELRLPDGAATAAVPGFNPIDNYEIALANLEPSLIHRPPPHDIPELLRWAEDVFGDQALAGPAAIGGASDGRPLSRSTQRDRRSPLRRRHRINWGAAPASPKKPNCGRPLHTTKSARSVLGMMATVTG